MLQSIYVKGVSHHMNTNPHTKSQHNKVQLIQILMKVRKTDNVRYMELQFLVQAYTYPTQLE